MASNAGNIKIAPHDAYYEANETACVDFSGKLPADLADKSFKMFGVDGTEYVVWFNLDAAGVAPVVTTETLVEVPIATGNTSGDMAAALAAVTVGSYVFTVDGDVVLAVNSTQLTAPGDAVDVDSELGIGVITKGGNIFLGLMDGDITITPSSSAFDVTAHQTGTTILA